jgi:sulfonate transport system substrate-binding protein
MSNRSYAQCVFASVNEMKTKPAPHLPLISKVTGHTVDHISRSWEHHAFPMVVPADMLDVMVEEEKWVAQKQNRAPRTRATLAAVFDPSILEEARRR